MSSRCLEQKWHPHRLLRWPLRRQTAKKERRKKYTARTWNSFTGSFIRGIKNERLARMETGSVCQIGFLDIKRVPRSVVSNLRPFSIRNRSRCMTENRHCFTQTACTGTRVIHLTWWRRIFCKPISAHTIVENFFKKKLNFAKNRKRVS